MAKEECKIQFSSNRKSTVERRVRMMNREVVYIDNSRFEENIYKPK